MNSIKEEYIVATQRDYGEEEPTINDFLRYINTEVKRTAEVKDKMISYLYRIADEKNGEAASRILQNGSIRYFWVSEIGDSSWRDKEDGITRNEFDHAYSYVKDRIEENNRICGEVEGNKK